VRYCVRKLRRDVLKERPSECDIEQLWPAANRQHRFPGLARSVHKSYFSIVAKAIHSMKTLMPGLAVERWIDVFASGQHQSGGGSHHASCRGRTGKWRHHQWYEPC